MLWCGDLRLIYSEQNRKRKISLLWMGFSWSHCVLRLECQKSTLTSGFVDTCLSRSEECEGRNSENTFLFKLRTSVLFVGQLMSLIRTSGSGSGMWSSNTMTVKQGLYRARANNMKGKNDKKDKFRFRLRSVWIHPYASGFVWCEGSFRWK